MTDILGITISSPGYHELAIEAARRFRKYSGLDCLIVTTERNGSYDAKYNLPLLGTRTLCFFDADLWFCRPFDLSPYGNLNGIAGVPDPTRNSFHGTFCYQDAVTLGMPPDQYLNTGLMIINPRHKATQQAFADAQHLMALHRCGALRQAYPLLTRKGKPARKQPTLKLLDETEQSLLNSALHRAGVEIFRLGDEWNYWPQAQRHGFMESVPPKPYCVHAAGIAGPGPKTDFLKAHMKVWEF